MRKLAVVVTPLLVMAIASSASGGWRLFGVTGKLQSGSTSRGPNDEQIHQLNEVTGASNCFWALPEAYARDSVAIGYSPDTDKLYFHSGSSTYGSKPVDDFYLEEIDLHTRAATVIYDNNGVNGTVISPPWLNTLDEPFAVRQLTHEGGVFYVTSKEDGVFTLTEDGTMTKFGDVVSGDLKGLGFQTIGGTRRMFHTNLVGGTGADLWLLDTATAFPLDDPVVVVADNATPIDGILALAEHPDTGELWAVVEQGGPTSRFLATLDITIDDSGASPDLTTATAHIVAPLGRHISAITWAPSLVPGDANNDMMVTGADFTIWADNFNPVSTGPPTAANPKPLGESIGDFNCDGAVSGADFTIWADNFGMTGDSPSGSPSSVPEPSSLVLGALGIGLAALVARRKRS